MSETYRLAPAPRFAGLRTWNCEICNHEDLAKPVFLSGPAGLIAAGTGCAAVVLGYIRPADLRRDFDALQAQADADDALLAERSARYSAVLLFALLTLSPLADVATTDMRRTFAARKINGETFPAFIRRVAATGEI